MRILHTADWHVGKGIRGHSRLDEQGAVLREIAAIAKEEKADLALVAGDLFESAAPTPDAEGVVWEALLGLQASGARVVVVAGNHDSHPHLSAMRKLLAALGITLLPDACPPSEGGVVQIVARGERALIALLPFCSERHAVRAADLMNESASHMKSYAERMRHLIATLTAGFAGSGAVNIVLAHAMVRGGKVGGGEREAHTVVGYAIDPASFPPSAHYVALGHLHRAQRIAGPCPIHYAGSPLPLDFGEEAEKKFAIIVSAEAGKPAAVEPIPLSAGRRLRTLHGTLDELSALAGETGDAYLRIRVNEAPRAGLDEEVRRLFPLAVQVQLDATQRAAPDVAIESPRAGRHPRDLFAEYVARQGIQDPRIEGLFAELYEEETAAEVEASAPEPAMRRRSERRAGGRA